MNSPTQLYYSAHFALIYLASTLLVGLGAYPFDFSGCLAGSDAEGLACQPC